MKMLSSVLVTLVLILPLTSFAGTLPATIAWTNTDTVDGVQIEKSNAPVGTFTTIKQIAALSITFTDPTNAPGDTACYRVAYFNTSGVGPYAGPVCKAFPTVPNQTPAGVTVN